VLQLTTVPTVKVGVLVRRAAPDVFEAMVDPAITSKFWFTKSSGRMLPGATLTWEWEMYGVSADVVVDEVEADRRVVFSWTGYDPEHPSRVEFQFIPWKDEATYVEVTESGFTGDGDQQVQSAMSSTGGFTFVLCALTALLEHDTVLRVVLDAHPPGLEA
jgi:uncharacterized protein YndB with AHSA1/START domain